MQLKYRSASRWDKLRKLLILQCAWERPRAFAELVHVAQRHIQLCGKDSVREALRAEGVTIDPKREDYDYGRFAWIMDPEGNRIEL